MSTLTNILLPHIEETTESQTEINDASVSDPGHRVILYNDDWHAMDEVVFQVHKATGYAVPRCEAITIEAHLNGRAICYQGTREKCRQVASVLREIRLQCEVDCD